MNRLLSILFIALTTRAFAQDAKPDYVTREEYEKVLKRLDTVTTELEQVKAKQNSAPTLTPTARDTDAALDEIRQTVHDIQDQLHTLQPGTHNFLVTGFGFVQFEDHRGDPSTFSAGVNPIFLFRIGDRLLFESELEIEFEGGDEGGGTEVNLETANLNFLVTDNLLIGGGRFKTPLGIFNDRLESKWINKLPDRPLPYADEVGIAQEASVGVYAKGAFRTHFGDVNYALYVANGPSLITDGENPGSLDFDNLEDVNDNKVVGGRIGWIPFPYLELGYSAQFAKVNPADFEDVHAFTQAVDLSYVRTLPRIKGQLDFRAEWVFSNVDTATYTIDNTPTRFSNDRNAGYVQLAYRPTLIEGKFLKNTEFVFRYDRLNVSKSAPNGGYDQRYTFGVDYWINPSTVVKIAYELDDREQGRNNDAFFLQAVMGF